jgi:hypothetical protein
METETKSPIESLFEKLKDYADTRIKLFKLKAIDKSSGFISSLLTLIILAGLGLICFIMLNIGLALLIGKWLGGYHWGFFIVAGFYIILGIIIFKFRKKWLKNPIASMMIKSLLD